MTALGARASSATGRAVHVKDLHANYGQNHTLKGITLSCPANEVTALIGPSGSGKSTVVRCINRMHDEIPGARAEGSVLLDELNVYDGGVDVTAVRTTSARSGYVTGKFG
jgi:phosphate transport system ATP-binding protein